MNKEERKQIKKLIEDFEYYNNGFHKLCGNDVEARNIKKSGDKYTADVILNRREDKATERYDGMEYPVAVLMKKDERTYAK